MEPQSRSANDGKHETLSFLGIEPPPSSQPLYYLFALKLPFYNPGLYVYREFTYFLYGPNQMPITIMLNLKGFLSSSTSSFPRICISFFKILNT
jgi:hypothetical protein